MSRSSAPAQSASHRGSAVSERLSPGGRVRAVIENVQPQLDGGRFPVKRVNGDRFVVEADIFTDGHDVPAGRLRFRHEGEPEWRETLLEPLGNDRWRGTFILEKTGRYHYAVSAWVDRFLSWRHDYARRIEPADLALAARSGAGIVRDAASRAPENAGAQLRDWAQRLDNASALQTVEELKQLGLDTGLCALALHHPDRSLAAQSQEFTAVVDRERARCSSWYEMFPRSAGSTLDRHGTFADCIQRLPYIAGMGFDVLYLPPIHPIGQARRKGPNNSLNAGPQDVGSPWAIGSAQGGHTSVHPELGTLSDFDLLVTAAREAGIEIALDIALQCAPDHPWVQAHPEWFLQRPDGSVQYAENPPKKYQDIYPFHFESPDWENLWRALAGIFEFWIAHGVRIFRVDNPHTKPFAFWEWVITTLKARHPDLIFLAEAFTRPRVMHRLAKLGFTQSYTYFAWRNSKDELTAYFTELAHGAGAEYFRPNAWPNTPDILPEALQHGGRPAFCSRLLLASTLSANYGIYGPAYELLENTAHAPGSEEYRDSEKYQLRTWNLDRPESLRELITRLNAIRRANPALQDNASLTFLDVDNDQLLAYCKSTVNRDNIVIVIVNLDPVHAHGGWLELDLRRLGLDARAAYQVHDQLADVYYLWHGARNFVKLAPGMGHVFSVRPRLRTEHDFDYFY